MNYDVIVINDGSKDDTEKILLENNISHIELIHNLEICSRFVDKNSKGVKSTFDRLIGIRIISFFIKIFQEKRYMIQLLYLDHVVGKL